MKYKFEKLLLLAVALSGTAAAQVVYQDNFDGDGIAVNTTPDEATGVGGRAEQFNTANAFIWNDDNVVDGGLSTGASTSGTNITTFVSDSSFNVTNGFTLEVVFDMESNVAGPAAAPAPFPSNHFSFGLIADAQFGENLNGFLSGGFPANTGPTTDAIGFSLGNRGGAIDEGLLQWDADSDMSTDPAIGVQSTLSAITFATGSDQTITLDVGPDGSYSYTYDGVTVEGTMESTIDLTQTYFFKARTQGSVNNVIQSITLTTNSAQFAAPTVTTAATVYDLNQPVDVVVTFDPSATSATLVNLQDMTTSVNLIVLDATDATPGDGQVVFTDMPTPLGLNTYEVTASRIGISALTESTEVTIIDPADEAADNALSLAIKADMPLFYYRFEDAADSTFVRDSSGNRFHTDDFTDNLLNVAFGNGPAPGGVGNAADFRPTDGARGIRVPTTSEMSESFTFTTLVNISPSTAVNPRTLLSMSNGTGTGATILDKVNATNRIRSFLDGTNDPLIPVNTLPLETTCMLHYVFTADEENGGGTHQLYVNGEAATAAITVAPFGPNEGNWILGATPILGDPSWFDWIDEAAIFETALTPAQITAQADAFFAAGDPLLGFYSDVIEVALGEPVQLFWKVSDAATAVTLNDEPVEGAAAGGIYTASFTPEEETNYTLVVTGPDGPLDPISINVTVAAPALPLTITDCRFSDATPPMVTIDFTGDPTLIYQVFASKDLNFDNPVDADSRIFIQDAQPDPTGIGTTTFEAEGLAEFYRLERIEGAP